MTRLTKRQAAILSAYTGVLCGSFADLQEYASEIMGRSLWTHEFGNGNVAAEIKAKSKDDFLSITEASE